MSNEIEVQEKKDLMTAMKTSLYPGASDESCELVLAVCRAAGMNPLLKPFHIVPMYNAKERKMKDTIMPGIGLYRINADRSGKYAGLSDPEFGPDVTEEFPEEKYEKEWDGKKTQGTRKALKITYPKWCRIAVRKVVDGVVYDFSAMEFWKENYATAARDSDQPNEMWANRPYGQLAKCAEAQALRKAFPDRVSSQPTAEEVEGKFQTFPGQVVDADPIKPPTEKKAEKEDKPKAEKKHTEPAPTPDSAPPPTLTDPDCISEETAHVIGKMWSDKCEVLGKDRSVEVIRELKEHFRFARWSEVREADKLDLIEAIQKTK